MKDLQFKYSNFKLAQYFDGIYANGQGFKQLGNLLPSSLATAAE
jgi:hypothetical protein